MSPKSEPSIADRIAAGANLSIPLFRQWSGLSNGKVYQEIAAGRLKVIKIGKRTFVTSPDAIAWRDSYRIASEAREVA